MGLTLEQVSESGGCKQNVLTENIFNIRKTSSPHSLQLQKTSGQYPVWTASDCWQSDYYQYLALPHPVTAIKCCFAVNLAKSHQSKPNQCCKTHT
jgi:hypothetical protein